MSCGSCCRCYCRWNLRIFLVLAPVLTIWACTVWQWPLWWWFLPGDRHLCETTPSNSHRPNVYCFYAIKNRIVPFRVELLNRDPDLVRIDSLLPDVRRRRALAKFTERFGTPSPTYTLLTNDAEWEAELLRRFGFRVSNITDVGKYEIPEAASIYELIDLASGLTTNNMDGPLALQTYVPPGHIIPHHDVYPGSDDPLHGRRFATLIVYLQSPSLGGATIFPQLGVGVRAEAGDAIFWYNVYPNGEPDWTLSHAGCPVFGGRKTIGTFWFRQFEQEFKKPCLPGQTHYRTF